MIVVVIIEEKEEVQVGVVLEYLWALNYSINNNHDLKT